MEKFGLRILEGYGVTETAPALAINTPMFHKPGTVGRLLPGIEARLEPVPGLPKAASASTSADRTSCSAISAPSGPESSSRRTTAGTTPAISSRSTSADFVTIKGRSKRFAKIGGEMVSLAAVEALAAELWPDHVSAVTAIPDPRKGERLVLVTDSAEATRAAFQAHGKARGATELMIPAEVIHLDAVAASRLRQGRQRRRGPVGARAISHRRLRISASRAPLFVTSQCREQRSFSLEQRSQSYTP